MIEEQLELPMVVSNLITAAINYGYDESTRDELSIAIEDIRIWLKEKGGKG
jgi:hypothetical protein